MKLPQVLAREADPEHVRLTLTVQAECEWFAGHFPDYPVLPGVAQVGWAIAFSRESFGFSADPPAMDEIKFLRPIVPGATVLLELHKPDGVNRVRYRLSIGGEAVGSGRLDFDSGRET